MFFALIYIQSQGSLRAFEGGYADDKATPLRALNLFMVAYVRKCCKSPQLFFQCTAMTFLKLMSQK